MLLLWTVTITRIVFVCNIQFFFFGVIFSFHRGRSTIQLFPLCRWAPFRQMLSFQKKGAQHLGFFTSLYNMGSPFWSVVFCSEEVQHRFYLCIQVGRHFAVFKRKGRRKIQFFIDGGYDLARQVHHFTVFKYTFLLYKNQ